MKNKSFLSSAMLIFGILTMLASAYIYYAKSEQFSSYDGETRGKIIEYIGNISNKIPVISYKVNDEKYILIDSSKAISSMQNKEFTIVYMKNDAEDARIYDNYQVWGVALSVFIIGVFCSIFGFIIFKVGF